MTRHKTVMCFRTKLLPITLLLATIPGNAQQPRREDPLLDAFTGSWVLNGIIAGKQTTHDVDSSWVLNHQFVQLHEVSREKTPAGLPQYEAFAFLGWDEKRKQYVAHWMDVFGGGFSSTGYATPEQDSIHLVFKSNDGDFHTTFAYDSKTGAWRWTMDAEQSGKLQPFARLRMIRR